MGQKVKDFSVGPLVEAIEAGKRCVPFPNGRILCLKVVRVVLSKKKKFRILVGIISE